MLFPEISLMTATIGMIVPPAGDMVPPEAYGLYPEGIRFAARSLILKELTLEGYSSVIDRVATLARQLGEEEGADAVVLMGTSLSFFRGSGFNEELVGIMERAAGIPATTMSNAVRDALGEVKARKVAVGTAYSDDVNRKLASFLDEAGFEVVHMQGLDITDVRVVRTVQSKAVAKLALEVDRGSDAKADAVLISCGGLPALDLAADVEPAIGKPVVASATAGVWAGMRLLGRSGASPRLGFLGMPEAAKTA